MNATLRASSVLYRALRRSCVGAVFLGALAASLISATGVVQLDGGPAPQKKERKPSPPLSSLPAPRAAGALKILLVDDDYSSNNHPNGSKSLSPSDEIFRKLVGDAVGGDAARWSTVVVDFDKAGPSADEMAKYNVVLWYNGGSYGGAYDNSAVLGQADEPNVRRYLEQTGGSFILISPGFVNAYSYGNNWEDAPVAFLTEVVGINGFKGLAKRFAAGTVTGADGASFVVEKDGPIEPIFSALHPDGAAVVFTSSLDPKETGTAGDNVAVATANPFGGGRFTYLGFSFENIGEAERAKAFASVLAAAGAGQPAATASAGAGVTPSSPAIPVASSLATARVAGLAPLPTEVAPPAAAVDPRSGPPVAPASALPPAAAVSPATPAAPATPWAEPVSPVKPGTLPTKTPVVATTPAAAPPASSAVPGKTPQRVTHDFSLLPGERCSVAFGVGEAGVIDATITVEGGAAVASLLGPDGRTVAEQSGRGTLTLHGETKGPAAGAVEFWRVVLRDAAKTGAAATKQRGEPAPSATGTIAIVAPPVVEETAKTAATQLRDAAVQRLPAIPVADVAALLAPMQQQLSREAAARHQAALTQVAPRLPVAVVRDAQQKIDLQALGPAQPEPLIVAPVQPFVVSSYTPDQLVTVSAVSVAAGDPGTPVVIDGAGFGDTAGVVHFQISADKKASAAVQRWSAKQILATVPSVPGSLAYDGTIWITAKDGRRSAPRPFRYLPKLVLASFGFPPPDNQRIGWGEFLGNRVRHWDFLMFFGNAGYDEFYFNSTLQNGWLVEGANIRKVGAGGGAYVVEVQPGTSSPRIKVRWWVDAMDAVSYDISVVIKGPEGVPFF